jgi:hypothetical protein
MPTSAQIERIITMSNIDNMCSIHSLLLLTSGCIVDLNCS